MNEVKTPKKPLIYYYGIVLLVLLLFNLLAMPWLSQRQIKEVDYGTFLSMVENGEVGRAELQEQENRILFTDKEETVVYKTAMVGDPNLTQSLLDAGVSFYGEEVEQINSEDKFVIGYSVPHSTGGFSNTFRYKGLSLNVYLDWAIGHTIRHAQMARQFINTFTGNTALNAGVLDTWSPQNPASIRAARAFRPTSRTTPTSSPSRATTSVSAS